MTAVIEPKVDELEEQDEIKTEEGKVAEVAKPTETDELKAAMTELAGTVQKLAEPKKQEEQELTPEQRDELWAVFNPETTRPDLMKKFFRLNPEATAEEIKEAKDLFGHMQQGLMKQAITGANLFLQSEAKKLRNEFKEALDFVSEAKAEKVRVQFYKAYPVLEDAKYAKVVTATAKGLADKDFKTNDDYFKALAEGAAGAIKDIIPDFDLGAVAEEKKKPAGTTPKLPRTSVGGQGGAGSGAASSGTKVTPKGGDINELDDD